jgi:hypothetical protein
MIKITYQVQEWLYTINVSNRNLIKDNTRKELYNIGQSLTQFMTDHWKELDNEYKGIQSPEVQMLNLAELLIKTVHNYGNGVCVYKIDKD